MILQILRLSPYLMVVNYVLLFQVIEQNCCINATKFLHSLFTQNGQDDRIVTQLTLKFVLAS